MFAVLFDSVEEFECGVGHECVAAPRGEQLVLVGCGVLVFDSPDDQPSGDLSGCRSQGVLLGGAVVDGMRVGDRNPGLLSADLVRGPDPDQQNTGGTGAAAAKPTSCASSPSPARTAPENRYKVRDYPFTTAKHGFNIITVPRHALPAMGQDCLPPPQGSVMFGI